MRANASLLPTAFCLLPTVLYLRPLLLGGNQFQIDLELAAFVDAHGFAAPLVTPQKIGIDVGALLGLFPGEQLIIARRDAPQREAALLIAQRRRVQPGQAAPVCIRRQHDRSPQERLLLTLHDTVDVAAGRADRDFERACRTALAEGQS